MTGSPMPTLSLKLNLALILTPTLILTLTLFNLLNHTNPNHNSKTIKSPLFSVNKSQHHRSDAVFLNTLYLQDYVGHQPALAVTDFPTSSTICLHVRFPTRIPRLYICNIDHSSNMYFDRRHAKLQASLVAAGLTLHRPEICRLARHGLRSMD